MRYIILYMIVIVFLESCSRNTANINNEKEGTLKASAKLSQVDSKRILLDSITAPRPEYTQVFIDSVGTRFFTFLNTYTNSIYFYDYNTLEFVKKIGYDTEGPDGVLKPIGYHIKNADSIYIYDLTRNVLKITNQDAKVLNEIVLSGKVNSKIWYLYYPQYIPKTVVPFIETPEELLCTGQFMGTVPDSLVSKFKITSRISFKTNQIRFSNGYPSHLYGNNYNWDGEMFTEVYPELHPDGDKLIYSFPVSHNLHIVDLDSEGYTTVYAGSNAVGTISSIAKPMKRMSRSAILLHVVRQHQYAAILYDKWRKVYYRFLLKGIPEATATTHWKDKPIVVIMMDETFNYLGETTLGTWREWHWQNAFVTQEGLNIEYFDLEDLDETFLNLKIFIPKKNQ